MAIQPFNIGNFDPVGALARGQAQREQSQQFGRSQEIRDLQGQLAQQGGGVANPINQQLAALSSDPVSAFGALSKTRQDAFKQDAASAARFIRAGQPERALELAQNRLSSLSSIDPNADPQDTLAAIQGIQQGIQTGDFSQILPLLDSVSGLDLKKLKVGQRVPAIVQNTELTRLRANFKGAKGKQARAEAKTALEDFRGILKINRLDEREKILLKASERIRVESEKADIDISKQKRLEKEVDTNREKLAKLRLQSDKLKLENRTVIELRNRAKQSGTEESTGAINLIDSLLSNDRFSAGFGKIVTATPDLLKPQEALDVRAQVDQIVGLISLEARQKLKGSGQISDREQQTLQESATTLRSPLISDSVARAELRKVKAIFENALDFNQQGLIDFPQTEQTQDQVINFDSQGNIIP